MPSSINASTTAGLVNTADTSGVLQLQTAGTTAISIDASQAVSFTNAPTVTGGTANGVAYLNGSKVLTTGSALVFDGANLGVGVTPQAWGGSGLTALQVRGLGLMASGTEAWAFANAYFDGANTRYINNGFSTYYRQNDSGTHKWFTAPSGTAGNAITFTQAMTLDASGNLLVGTTSLSTSERLNVTYAPANTGIVLNTSSTPVSNSVLIDFLANGTRGGVIVFTNLGVTTAYVTSSDYRLKENIQPMTGALAKVAQLKPVTYKWKNNGTNSDGFIAHELAEVCPQAVNGEKDAVNEDGSINPQGIDTSFLVATLTAAIQEQQALITQLQADVAALKGA
jgi:hypothetical protein